jgi:glycosyltransferase involved in cell wall biosynthesis
VITEYPGVRADVSTVHAAVEWISWDSHRRTMQLANALGVPVRLIRRGRFRGVQRLSALLRSVLYLFRTRARVVIVPNPSLALAVTTCVIKRFKGYRVIQDLHSYFYQTLATPRSLHDRVYARLSRYCLRQADLTIVTNEFLREMIGRLGARAVVLQDRIPDLASSEAMPLAGRWNAVFVCTYSEDEPIDEVLKVGALVSEGTHIYVTGRLPRIAARWTIPRNVHLTGYLTDAEYTRLLSSADIVLALTTRDHTLLCAAYEAVALGKPLVMSDTPALREYFTKGVVYTRNDGRALTAAVEEAIRRLAALRADVCQLKDDLARPWGDRFAGVRAKVQALTQLS